MNFISLFIGFIIKNKLLVSRIRKIVNLPVTTFNKIIGSPERFIKLVESLPQNIKARLTGEINAVLKQFDIKNKALKKLKTIGRKELFGFRQEFAISAKSECKNLISSWIRAGCYEPDDPLPNARSNGTLLLILKSGSSYVFYNVSVLTWALMKKAKVPNGGGAGSIFWQYYWKARIGTERTGAVDRMYQNYRTRKKQDKDSVKADIASFKTDARAIARRALKPRGFKGVK